MMAETMQARTEGRRNLLIVAKLKITPFLLTFLFNDAGYSEQMKPTT